jgi:hypothetical protein
VSLASLVSLDLQEHLDLQDNRVHRVQLVLLGHRVLRVLRVTQAVLARWASRGQKVRRGLRGQQALVGHLVNWASREEQDSRARQVIVA